MRPIPQKLREQIAERPEMKRCIYANNDCCDEFGNKPGRPEWEHAFIYAGKQINEWWAIIGVCWYHHRGKGLDKDYNKYRALIRMNGFELIEACKKYPRFDWILERSRLIKKYENVVGRG